ncbi:TPA: hypothetical protein ACT192_001889 [Klebsiella oxytoca]
MKLKIPTYDDYYSHDGLHYHQLWNSINDDWVCPSCGRSKYQIMKWTLRFPRSPNAFMGWVAALHKHHDHSIDSCPSTPPRFPQTLICGQCNAAEGVVKRKLKLPSKFSFSPQEMRDFIQAIPHGKHIINYDRALAIFKDHTNQLNSLLKDY